MSQLISQDSHDLKLKKPHKKSVDNKEKTEIKKKSNKIQKRRSCFILNNQKQKKSRKANTFVTSNVLGI